MTPNPDTLGTEVPGREGFSLGSRLGRRCPRVRLLLPLLLLVPVLHSQEPGLAPPAEPPALDAEPPALFALRCGEESLQFRDGERFVLPTSWAGRECALERLPLRRFEIPGALAFEYPDGAKWLAAVHVPEFLWWHVGLGQEFVMLQRHRGSGDASHQQDLYAGDCLKAGGEDLGACSIVAGGRELRGRRVRVVSDEPYVQEIFGFEHAGETWLLVLNHGDPASDAAQALAASPTALPIATPTAVPTSRPLRDRLLASFRFL